MTAATDLSAARGSDGVSNEDAVPPSRVDFYRTLVCILGLPFDAICLSQAVEQIRRDAFAGRRCFVSTPNLNFAITARTDPEFRNTVLRSDLSLIDGMPLVWVARLLGLPIRERVAGSDVFEALQAHAGPPISVYLIGGPPGAGAQACDSINRRGGGVRCVGHDSAGFGSIESMSSDELIRRINRSDAHFVLVSLGAKKGQAWLEHNAARLTAPVLSHLGAVLNFAAGTVRRAPRRMRWLGLEWLWRIKEEPGLWRRYWNDGVSAVGLLVTRVVPDMFASRVEVRADSKPARIEVRHLLAGTTFHLHGCWRNEDCALLRSALAESATDETRLTIDMSDVEDVTGTFVALMLIARGWFGGRGSCDIIGANAAVTATIRRNMAEHLLSPAE